MVMTNIRSKVTWFGGLQATPKKPRGWTSQDLADLFRIGDQLTKFGFPVAVHTGQSDEGDPWAVFERDGTDEVVVHVARIDSELVIVDVVRDRTHRGIDFRSLADKLLAEAPLTLPRIEDRGNVVLHPRMVMAAFVAAAFVLSEFANPSAAEASTLENDTDGASGAKVGQGRAATPSLQPDTDLAGKSAGRDGLSGMSTAQAIGMSGLAASFAALSAHLVFGPTKNEGDVPEDTGQEATSLFEAVVQSEFVALSQSDGGPSYNSQMVDVHQVMQASTPQGRTATKPDAPVRVVIDAADADGQGGYLATPSAGPIPAEEGVVNLDSVILERLSVDQDARLLTAPLKADVRPAPVTDTSSLSADDAFNRVIASVTILDQSQVPTFLVDADANGAVVVMASDLADNLIDADELINGFPTSSPDGNASVDVLFERYLLASELSQSIHLQPDFANFLVYAGGDVQVSGFAFGRDSIVFIEDLTPPGWLTSVEVVGSDVVLLGHGGSVTLLDAVSTFI